ncbi:MAG TPA: acyl-CoA dehydrogenase family protein [Acidimicrobiales bacterium]|nr:acyl-CoA dehydrogenase family protein [Acidimicrobiales bacterium]HLH47255.1 acyl-CoA dehydrogenase family protein [Acidimicrobiales bacterium]
MGEVADQELIDAAVERLLEEHPPATTDPVTFLRAQFDAGLAYVWFPKGYGGLDQPVSAQKSVDERLAAAGAPPSGRVTNAIAAGQGAATILAYGSEDQKRRYLRPLFTAELMGCQLYSEPGSGSDLASLATRAVRDGDDWVVNGQKVWTSGAHRADVAILLARTDPDAPKHAGLTQFVLDMHAPGVEVRPLRQMTGGAEFNEVFLTDVRVPDSERLGPVNGGWAVSQHTLVYERYNMPEPPGRGEGPIAAVVAAWQARADKTSPEARALRAELLRHWVAVEVVRLLQLRAGVLRSQGTSGPEGSLGKLAVSVTSRRLAEWAPALLGPAGTVTKAGYRPTPDEPGWGRRGGRDLVMACVGSPGTAIAGGTDQIQRNIIGDRVLGLPREPAVDRGVAWSQTLRNAP